MLETLRKEAEAHVGRTFDDLLSDAEAASLLSVYENLTGTRDIVAEIPEGILGAKRAGAEGVRRAFFSRIAELPGYAAFQEAKSVLDAYATKIEDRSASPLEGCIPAKNSDEMAHNLSSLERELDVLVSPRAAGNEPRYVNRIHIEDSDADIFAFMDKGIPETADDELVNVVPPAPAVSVAEEDMPDGWTPAPFGAPSPPVEAGDGPSAPQGPDAGKDAFPDDDESLDIRIPLRFPSGDADIPENGPSPDDSRENMDPAPCASPESDPEPSFPDSVLAGREESEKDAVSVGSEMAPEVPVEDIFAGGAPAPDKDRDVSGADDVPEDLFAGDPSGSSGEGRDVPDDGRDHAPEAEDGVSIVTGETLQEYKDFTDDLEAERMRKREEAFLNGLSLDGSHLARNAEPESHSVRPKVMYWKGEPVSPEEYDRLFAAYSSGAGKTDASGGTVPAAGEPPFPDRPEEFPRDVASSQDDVEEPDRDADPAPPDFPGEIEGPGKDAAEQAGPGMEPDPFGEAVPADSAPETRDPFPAEADEPDIPDVFPSEPEFPGLSSAKAPDEERPVPDFPGEPSFGQEMPDISAGAPVNDSDDLFGVADGKVPGEPEGPGDPPDFGEKSAERFDPSVFDLPEPHNDVIGQLTENGEASALSDIRDFQETFGDVLERTDRANPMRDAGSEGQAKKRPNLQELLGKGRVSSM